MDIVCSGAFINAAERALAFHRVTHFTHRIEQNRTDFGGRERENLTAIYLGVRRCTEGKRSTWSLFFSASAFWGIAGTCQLQIPARRVYSCAAITKKNSTLTQRNQDTPGFR